MTNIDAIFQDGVFKPITPISLPQNQRVRLSIERVSGEDALAWLREVQEHQKRIVAERGFLPDSTPDIAEDRLRDV